MIFPRMIRCSALLLTLILAGPTSAQAAMQLERWTYAHLEWLRAELLTSCLRAAPEDLVKVAELLAENPVDANFQSTLKALALLRGQRADQEFLNRARLLPIVLPRVVDPELEAKIHCTMYAPRRLEPLGEVDFRLILESADGTELGSTILDERTSLEDLLRFRPTTDLSLQGQQAGSYRLRVATRLDAAEPRAWDLPMGVDFQLLSGFKQRADGLEERIAAMDLDAFSLRDRAILAGAAWQLGYTMGGEPAVPSSDPVAALMRMEAILANLQTNKPALFGLHGRQTITLPVVEKLADRFEAAHLAEVSVDLPGEGREAKAKPLILFIAGRPAWTPQVRPTTPKTRRPEWLLDELRRAGFDQEGRYHLAVMESAGRYRNAAAAVASVLRELIEILPVVPGQVILAGEREGAWAVGRAATTSEGLCVGLILVTGGAMPPKDMQQLNGMPILAVQAHGHPGNRGLRHLQEHALNLGHEAAVTLLPAQNRPWPLALALSAGEIESFAERVFAH